jgi:hypothetical protein
MDFLFAPILGYLGPFDLLKLLHVSKTAREAAVPHLKSFQEAPQTREHARMLSDWMLSPSVTTNNGVFQEMASPNHPDTAGPLRLSAIQRMGSSLEKNFVVLEYRKTYRQEYSCVAVFNNNGAFVAIYEFWSEQFYEAYVDKNTIQGLGRTFNSAGGSNHSMPNIRIRSSAGFHVNRQQGRWIRQEPQLDFERQEGFSGSVTSCNYMHFMKSFMAFSRQLKSPLYSCMPYLRIPERSITIRSPSLIAFITHLT